jgi:hypothetical protein
VLLLLIEVGEVFFSWSFCLEMSKMDFLVSFLMVDMEALREVLA